MGATARVFVARVLIGALVALLLGLFPAQAEKRVALVIGNAKYLHEKPLLNPPNDAADVAVSLGRLGFAVTLLSDVGSEALRRALRDFDYEARSADIAVVFFAGHGLEMGGENYLVPVNAELKSDRDVQYEAVALKTVIATVETARRLGLVILDACRNDPFRRRMTQTAGLTRSVSRGLSRVEPTGNVLVVYAAREGMVADDGSGRNSPFTSALLKHIETPGLEIGYLFRLVRDDVLVATGRQQDPPIYGTLGSEQIFLKTAKAKPSVNLASSEGAAVGSAETPSPPTQNTTVAAVVPPANSTSVSPCGAAAALASVSQRRAQPLSANEECGLKPKDVFKECETCPEMVVIPAGEFMMGSPANEEGRHVGEGPQHRVKLARPFAVAKFEATVVEWSACAATGECPNDVLGVGRQPASKVPWEYAKAYVAWLSKMTGKAYRLLSEAEWEYAARAGTSTAYSWGPEIGKGKANCFSCGSQWDRRTAPVGSFAANAFGLYDMHGNVSEWVEDCWHQNYDGAPKDGTAWTKGGDCFYRVQRGGESGAADVRSAQRSMQIGRYRVHHGGFRVARTLVTP